MRAAWWWIDRWRKSTAYTDMTMAEQGAYRNLLDELWLRDGFLPTNDRILGKIAGDVLEWPTVREAVMSRFIRHADGWTHPTHDEVAAYSDRQAQKGKKRAAGAARGPTGTFQPSQPEDQPRAGGLVADSQPAGSQPPSPSPSPSKSKDQSPKGVSHPTDAHPGKQGKLRVELAFGAKFWPGVPNKIGKKGALKSFQRAVKDGATIEEILAGLPAYRESERLRSGQSDYRPLHPTTWLNAGRWMDEAPERDNGPPLCKCKRLLQTDESLAAGVCQDCREHGEVAV